MNKTRNTFFLILTAFIWGVAFVAQSVGNTYVGPWTFTASRSVIGALFLIPCIAFLDKFKEKNHEVVEKGHPKTLLLGGICCGTALAIASMLQQYGIGYTTVGKAGFITALYIILVPILGIFLKRKPGLRVWISVLLSVIGLYFLCMTDRLYLGKGDLLVMLCALAFSFHILIIDHYSPMVDGVRMACIQFAVVAVLCGIPALILERPTMSALLSAWAPILYAGMLSSGVGYTLQIVAQKNYDPPIASLLMSLESVFSVLAGWVILKQALSARELFGCVLMFGAIILVQLPERKKHN